ncbi:MAG: histidine kinase [Bacteroidetes bacterium]|nr:histidine kinase [Bacteroidota bacterium]
MKALSLNSRKIEILFYVLTWVLIFSVPYFSERSSGHLNWNSIARHWTGLSGYLLVFLVNVYILVPHLLLKKRYLNYFVLTTVMILLVIAVNIIIPPAFFQNSGPGMDVMPDGFTPRGPNTSNPKPLFMVFFDTLIMCILTLGAGTTIKLMSKWLSEERMRKDAEKEQLKTNLALLRHQVSPHFFMNTLNNIHSLIEIDSEKAQDAVFRLSTLMRYLLYDSARNTIELKKEIEFINSFISLMQLRHSDEVEVTVVIPEKVPVAKIPPMLFISLLENAFKHGVSYPYKSFIYFELQVSNTFLTCIIKNSKHKVAANYQGEYSGIGLDNIKESLKLLYEDNFQLNIRDKESEFEVDLKIPL